jgi:hypothetical protein
MKNSKLVAEAKRNPQRIYQRPIDVLRDRRLDDAGRREILVAWEQKSDEADRVGTARPDELEQALRELEQRISP